jgi:hypothetical protein
MLMEDVMTHTDKLMQCAAPVVVARYYLSNPHARSLYILVISLLATLMSLPAVGYFTAAAHASGVIA